MKKVLKIGAAIITIVLSVYIINKLIYVGALVFRYMLENPLYTMLYTLGLLTVLYIYFKLRDRYGR